MSISRTIAVKADIEDSVVKYFSSLFEMNDAFARSLYKSELSQHISRLVDDITFVIEAPYIDKVYRDSYYTYFSSKLGKYKRDCIRLSFFAGEVTEEMFRDSAAVTDLKKQYLGFIILRPLSPTIVGRSVVSPRAVNQSGLLIASTTFDATVSSIKMEVSGFPHSSQDTETMTCAETSIWALMEFFGYKYAEYKPVLPSKITQVLKDLSSERQVPSRGLNIQQMSFALKEFGFGTRVYEAKEFGDEFPRLFSTYIESGIPIIVAVDNRENGGKIGHAFLAIGHRKTGDGEIDSLHPAKEDNPYISKELIKRDIRLYDHDDMIKDFVFIDDNNPAYCTNKFVSPTSHYSENTWHDCKVTYFIVPLYPKVYLEAFESKNFCKQFLLDNLAIPDGEEIYLRHFLASSRSYKHYIAMESNLVEDIREMILEIEMPKFIWVTEISDKALIKGRQANGFIILDATEANVLKMKPLIVSCYRDEMLTLDTTSDSISRLNISLPNFSIFTINLKGF